MRDARVLHQVPGPSPAQPPEELDVRRLDEGFHLPSAVRPCRADREPHERRAEAEMTVARQDCQAVALPATVLVKRIEPDRPADNPVRQPHYVDGRRVIVMAVPVVGRGRTREAEQTLLDHEDLVSDPEVGVTFGRGGYRTAAQRRRARHPAGCRRLADRAVRPATGC
jgi:hypothetical protein